MAAVDGKRTRNESEEVINIFDESRIEKDESGINSDNINVAKSHPAFHYEGDNANHVMLEGGKVLLPPFQNVAEKNNITNMDFT